jgi:hypothetical protein
MIMECFYPCVFYSYVYLEIIVIFNTKYAVLRCNTIQKHYKNKNVTIV